MDLFIETLTGTAFELRVSPFETIMSVKAKIQRLEGIPMSQQHLIWRSVELEDDYCLHDYNIADGATLQLVLAMRGGPINTRRIPVEDPTIREMAEYMEVNRDEIWDKLPKDNRQVTLLVFRDGDQLNFFRVVDRGDGTLTPLSDSLSGASMYNLYDEEEEDNQPPISQEAIKENSVTMNKMRVLKNKMESQKNMKPKYQPAPPPIEKPTSTSILSARRRLQLTSASATTKTHETAFRVVDHQSASRHQPKAGAVQGSPSKQSSATSRVMPKGPLPPVNTRRKTSQIDVSDFLVQPSQDTKIVPSSRALSRSAIKEGRKAISEIVKDSKEIKPLGSISKPVSHHKETRTSSPSHGATSLDYASGSASLRRSRIPEDSSSVRYPLDMSTGSGGFRRLRGMENRVPTPEGRRSGLLNDSLSYSYRISHGSASNNSPSHSHHLPPVKTKPHPPPQLLPAVKKKTRCFLCGKKTGLATTYQCRCGNSFCATHRYAEAHSCTYDYKSEGRKIIEQNNPVIAAPKLPKI